MHSFRRSSRVALVSLVVACNSDSANNADESSSSEGTSSSSTDPDSSSSESSSGTVDPDTSSSTAPSDCGNAMIDAGEDCDGEELGGMSCTDVDRSFTGGTLACDASCSFDTSACTSDPLMPIVTLNEITSTPVPEGPYTGAPDAIELYNAGNGPADLSGWRLTDDPKFAADATYTFPAGSTIEAGEYLVLVQIGINKQGDYPFGISDDSVESIVLDNGTGTVIDSVDVDGYDARISWCRVPDGDGDWTWCDQTLGETNVEAVTACGNDMIEDAEECDGPDLGGADCVSIGLGFTGGTLACTPGCVPDVSGCVTDSQIVINELESTGDDIELFNAGAQDIDISGWIMTDDDVDAAYDPLVDTEEVTFVAGTIIGAGEYLVVPVGMGDNQHPFGLSGNGDQVTLAQVGPVVVIDTVAYGMGEAATSYCRQPNGPGGTWTADCTPSMGGAN
ncbi:MAG TPA: lamin tail domain-containing protein [Nannocystaceae bacterium]|nr:lamin tail domain-containing protein [Nannocystaceae bacterium]